MRFALVVFLALALPAAADDFSFAGTLNASSGASTNNASSACTKADGSTAALGAFGGSPQFPIKLYIQCDVDSRVRTSTSSSAVASNTRGADFGMKLAADQLFPIELREGYLAIIPASGSGAAHCDLYRRF